jgi:cytoskeleton protein RodZ
VREVEANVDRRITRVEQALEGQSGLIEDLHVKSASTEDSVRKLLTAVEGFCAQTTRQLEAISAPGAATAAAPLAEAIPETPAAGYRAVPAAEPVIIDAPIAETIREPEPPPVTPPVQQHTPLQSSLQPQIQPSSQPHIQPSTSPVKTARRIQPSRLATVKLGWAQKLDWRLAGGAVLLVAGAVIIIGWAWQNLFSGPSVQRVAATSSPVTSMPAPAVQAQPPAPPPPAQQFHTAEKSAALSPASSGQHVTLQASELTWVSTRNAAGTPMLARVFQKGDSQSLDLPDGATVRVGNAGGLSILLNGNPIAALGKHGQVREVVFKNGSYKVVVAD